MVKNILLYKQNTERETKMSNLTKKRFTSFIENQKHSEQGKRFPCLYNKSTKSHKNRHGVRNALPEVASNLEFVEVGIFLVLETKFCFQRSFKNI